MVEIPENCLFFACGNPKLEEEILAKPGIHKLFVVGELGRHYFAKRGQEIDTHFKYTVQKPTMHRARDISGVLIEQFEQGELDEIYIVYTMQRPAITFQGNRNKNNRMR